MDSTEEVSETLQPLNTDEALNCPLCGYDLRGLTSTRCPECGHAFDLVAIRQAKLNRAEWIFETAQNRRFATAIRTSAWSLLPLSKAGFWHRFPASTPVVVPRLRRFAMLWLGAMLLFIALVIAGQAAYRYFDANQLIGTGNRNWAPGSAQYRTLGYNQYTYLDALVSMKDQAIATAWMLPVLAWPLLTFAAINVFGLTLQRAGIRSGHLWRVAIYPLPTMVLLVLALQASAFASDHQTDTALILAVLSLPLVTMLHLIGAHVDYLRLRHALGQAILIWLMVWLAILAVFMNVVWL